MGIVVLDISDDGELHNLASLHSGTNTRYWRTSSQVYPTASV